LLAPVVINEKVLAVGSEECPEATLGLVGGGDHCLL
jgi:hypothetical protein